MVICYAFDACAVDGRRWPSSHRGKECGGCCLVCGSRAVSRKPRVGGGASGLRKTAKQLRLTQIPIKLILPSSVPST